MQYRSKPSPPPAPAPKKGGLGFLNRALDHATIIEYDKSSNDIHLNCKDCGSMFVFDEGQQEFLEQLLAAGKIQKITKPVRCLPCRAIRRAKGTNKTIHI